MSWLRRMRDQKKRNADIYSLLTSCNLSETIFPAETGKALCQVVRDIQCHSRRNYRLVMFLLSDCEEQIAESVQTLKPAYVMTTQCGTSIYLAFSLRSSLPSFSTVYCLLFTVYCSTIIRPIWHTLNLFYSGIFVFGATAPPPTVPGPPHSQGF